MVLVLLKEGYAMSAFTLIRTDSDLPDNMDSARKLLFGALDGFSETDRRAWRRFWKRVIAAQTGEVIHVEMKFPRNGRFHRYHMAMEKGLFDNQERFDNFDVFRDWIKINAGWVEWHPGLDGTLTPVPRSISYHNADEEEFRSYHDAVMAFLRNPEAEKLIWPHAAEGSMQAFLEGFE